jgi:hypothetical protein
MAGEYYSTEDRNTISPLAIRLEYGTTIYVVS